MNQSDWTHEILNHLDPALIEQTEVRAKRALPRAGRIALIAACLCAVLVSGAFAAQTIWGIPIFKPIDTSPVDGTPANGFTTVIELPEGTEQSEGSHVNPLLTPDVNGVYKQWEEVYSQRLRDYAATLKTGTLGKKNFSSWDNAEEFIGIDLLNNPVLERGTSGSLFYSDDPNAPKTQTPCCVTVTAMDSALTSVQAEAVYFLNYVDVAENEHYSNFVPVRMELFVQSYTKNSPIAPEDMFIAFGFPEGYTFTTETYTTPSGLTASIVGVHDTDGVLFCYCAQFALNRNAVTLSSTFVPDPAHALSTLKEVLDAFQ